MPAYIPPSKRPGFNPKPTDTPPWTRQTSNYTKTKTHLDHILELEQLFKTHQQGTFNYFANKPTTSKAPLTFGQKEGFEGIPNPIAEPHVLGHLIVYIMIFPRAQPLWESGGELWSHTGSEIMVDDWQSRKINFGRPIPVFGGGSTKKDRIVFLGWWTMNALREVPPDSPELVDLLETKERAKTYGREGRTPEAWSAALREKWVKTRFTPAPDSFERYSELVDPFTLGVGEGAKLILSVGRLDEELKIFERLVDEEKSNGADKATVEEVNAGVGNESGKEDEGAERAVVGDADTDANVVR